MSKEEWPVNRHEGSDRRKSKVTFYLIKLYIIKQFIDKLIHVFIDNGRDELYEFYNQKFRRNNKSL